jgi:hypothetical protein
VGSCTDLSATIIQPLKDKFSEQLEIAPFTVLADPARLAEILTGAASDIHPSAKYIIEKQFDEADIILINKADLLKEADLREMGRLAANKWENAIVMTGSALTDAGINEWTNFVLEHNDAGTHLAVVDYDVYAEGEAALGWLNARFSLYGKDVDWDTLAGKLLYSLSKEFDSMNAAVGHVKLLLESGKSFIIGNVTGKRDTASLRQSAVRSDTAKLTLNVRVELPPVMLKMVVRDEVKAACGDTVQINVVEMNCLTPGRPNPTYRYSNVVK